MANNKHPFTYCEGCPEQCPSKAEAERKQAQKLCDPCDSCWNVSSPACLDCDTPDFSGYEAAE